MALPLPLLSDHTPQGSAHLWKTFLARREALVARMNMDACNGCDGCGLRCMSGFTVTREEYEAAQAYLQTLPEAEVARVLGQEKTIPWPGAEDTGATVTHCRYRDRDRNNCFLYGARPTVCRLFGQVPWLPCPLEAVEPVETDAAQTWRDYLHFERRTWEEWDEFFAEEKEISANG